MIDDLAGVASVVRDVDLWLHVDGAYGGAGLLALSVRDRYAGIEQDDYPVIAPHKWLFAPFARRRVRRRHAAAGIRPGPACGQ
ncbi:pyridoxal-dependent decarboxylase [Streptomyces californicus]|uniref:pyridoxal-dependent decarboxylase n=1 Tax=Streptomyces californicus TaxID=67351 RepID=UPI00381130C3